MNKENILYGIVGLLLGLIIGFVFANKANQSSLQPRKNPTMAANSNIPADHPAIDGSQQNGGMMPQVADAIKDANEQSDNFEAQMKVAAMYIQIRSFDKAIEYLQKANKIKPEDYELILRLGHANFDAGHFEEAEKWYSKFLAKNPDDVAVRTDMASTFVLRTPPDYDKAIKDYLNSLQRNPNHKETLIYITRTFIQKGDFQKAKEYLARLEKADPGNQEIADLRSKIEKQVKS
jgi:tetratricopeptide (TPR) repeat protein